jgi:hypothetical protein
VKQQSGWSRRGWRNRTWDGWERVKGKGPEQDARAGTGSLLYTDVTAATVLWCLRGGQCQEVSWKPTEVEADDEKLPQNMQRAMKHVLKARRTAYKNARNMEAYRTEAVATLDMPEESPGGCASYRHPCHSYPIRAAYVCTATAQHSPICSRLCTTRGFGTSLKTDLFPEYSPNFYRPRSLFCHQKR